MLATNYQKTPSSTFGVNSDNQVSIFLGILKLPFGFPDAKTASGNNKKLTEKEYENVCADYSLHHHFLRFLITGYSRNMIMSTITIHLIIISNISFSL